MFQPYGPILMVEDDPAAAELMRLAFRKVGLNRPLKVLWDGDEAVAYLSGLPPYQNREENPMPSLLLLDVNLPRRSGLEILSWLRSHVTARPLPVVMLTASASATDIEDALRLGIQSYCVKPTHFDDLKKLARMIRRKVEGEDAVPEEPSPDSRPGRPPSSRRAVS